MKKFKKNLLYILIALIISISVSSINLFFPKQIEKFDSIIQDTMFVFRGEKEDSGNVIIIDIDEKSLNKLGQWPWSRNILAKILENLTLNDIAIIGIDIVFAEADRTSPAKIFKQLNMDISNAPNYDEEFGDMVENTPTILGYQFELEDKKYTNKDAPHIPALIIEKNKDYEYDDYLIKAKGTILNHQSIQNKGYSSGFFNIIPDSTGTIKKVPLVIQYDEQLYPSLSLELYRVAMGIKKIIVNYSDFGIEYIQLGDLVIPTDRYGRVNVNFLGKEKTFSYISAVDIYNNIIKKEDLEGKIALIGTSAAGLKDLRSTPFESIFPGVEIHANTIDNLITKDFLSSGESLAFNVILIFIFVFITILVVVNIPLWLTPFFISFLLGGVWYSNYYILFTEKIILDTFLLWASIIISFLIALFIDYWFETKSKIAIKNKFASKVSKDVMDSLLKNENNTEFEAMQREITVFFSDIRSFTNISEYINNPKLLVEFLNIYMTPMSEIIIENKGTIDKFIGDAIMAYWNAPSLVENHATKAVQSALEQLHILDNINKQIQEDERFTALNGKFKQNGVQVLQIGIGLNTGMATIGEMGAKQRSDYTVIGDAINLGARLESLCKYYNVRCIISDYTKAQLEDKFICKYLDLVAVKGKTEPVRIWEVIDYNSKNNSYTNNLYNISYDKLEKEILTYNEAIELYLNGSFKEALRLFNDIVHHKSINDKLITMYVNRCIAYIETPPQEFNGVYIHQNKG
jgi:adenylate cyclase